MKGLTLGCVNMMNGKRLVTQRNYKEKKEKKKKMVTL